MKTQQFKNKEMPHWKKQNFLSKTKMLYMKHKGFERTWLRIEGRGESILTNSEHR